MSVLASILTDKIYSYRYLAISTLIAYFFKSKLTLYM